MSNQQIVVRLNSESFPPTELERSLWSQLPAEVRLGEGGTPDEIMTVARDATSILIIAARLPATVIASLPNLRHISRIGTGTDKIAVDEATRRGILVTNVPDFSTEEVADHTMALLLSAVRQLPHFSSAVARGQRELAGKILHRLASRTVALIGFGNIGKAVAKRLAGFGPRILAVDPRLDSATAQSLGVEIRALDAALVEADIVVLLCPLLPATKNMLNAERIARMKSGVILVNTARGELVDEIALAQALHSGTITFAAIDVFGDTDVFAVDGFPTTHPIFHSPNTVLTPHVAAHSEESMADCHRRAIQAVADVLSGRWPRHPVNPEVIPRQTLIQQEQP